MSKRIARTLTVVSLALFVAACSPTAEESANKLFVEAQQRINSVGPDVDAQMSVDILKEAEANLDQIISKYPSSNIAVILSSGQSIGDVSLETIRAIRLRYENIAKEGLLTEDIVFSIFTGMEEGTRPNTYGRGDLIINKTAVGHYEISNPPQDGNANYSIKRTSDCVYNIDLTFISENKEKNNVYSLTIKLNEVSKMEFSESYGETYLKIDPISAISGFESENFDGAIPLTTASLSIDELSKLSDIAYANCGIGESW